MVILRVVGILYYLVLALKREVCFEQITYNKYNPSVATKHVMEIVV